MAADEPDGPRANAVAGERGATGGERTTSRDAILSVQGVGVRLGGRAVLRDVDFDIQPGEFTGLIGSNGAGKTTLLRVILGLQTPSAGRVLIAGAPRRSRTRDARGARQGGRGRGDPLIGYVPQKFLLDPDMPLRARDLVGLGLDGHRLGIPRPSRARRARVQEMLAAVDAERFADTRVGSLSGGEQQRVLIAHALIGHPRLLLLDEPLANLDLRSAHDVVALLARIAREQEIAVLISAHEMNPLLPVMDRIVYLAGGRAASGRTAEVVRADVLSRLYGDHVDVLNVHGRVLVVAGAGEGSDLAGHEAALPGVEVIQ
jgi:zinc/manganese transport system ATP-binding protein